MAGDEQFPSQLLNVYLLDVLAQEPAGRVVGFIGQAQALVYVYTGKDLAASVQQSTSQAAGPTKESQSL